MARVVAEAAPQPRRGHDALMLDMDDATVTQATLDLHRTLSEQGLPVAVTLQGYLHRSATALDDLVARGSWVRLVKGAFPEPAHVAARQPAEIDSRFRQAVSQLLSPAALEAGVFPTFATHDHRIIAEIIAHARVNRWPGDSVEFEMLHGVRTELQRQLVAQGHRVRVFLPFGRDWFPYSIRRVGESPRNLRFVAATLLRRS